ncbi:hypothetical protein [Endozoicomonas sp. 2B-B]
MKSTDGRNFVTDDNTGGFFVIDCECCGHVFNSKDAHGGGQIADTGDYDDCYCPKCGAADPAEADNANKVWNVQQARINELESAINQTIGWIKDTNALRSEDGEESLRLLEAAVSV